MATKEHAGIRKLAERLQLLSTKGLAGTEQFNETEAELNRVLGPILDSGESLTCIFEGKSPTHGCTCNACEHAAALEKFNQGE